MSNFDTIERFLNGEMKDSEARLFQKKIEDDSALALEVHLQRHENNALEGVAFDLLKEEIASLQGEDLTEVSPKDNPIRKFSNRKFLPLILLSIISAILICCFFWKKQATGTILIKETPIRSKEVPIEEGTIKKEEEMQEKPTFEQKKQERIKQEKNNAKPDALIKTNYPLIALNEYQKNEDKINLKGKEEILTSDEKWNAIIEQFNSDNFAKTIGMVNELTDEEPFLVDAQHIKAKSLFLSQQFAASTTLYLSLMEYGDPFQIHNYDYELLLNYLAQLPNKKADFQTLYEKIAGDVDHTFQNAVLEMGQTLEELNY